MLFKFLNLILGFNIAINPEYFLGNFQIFLLNAVLFLDPIMKVHGFSATDRLSLF
jgi:hypothetical protein